MSEVVFIYEDQSIIIRSNINQKVKDICQNFCNRINIDMDSLKFLFGDNILNKEKKLKEITNENKITIYVNKNEDKFCSECGRILNNKEIDEMILLNNNINNSLIGINNQIEYIMNILTNKKDINNANTQLQNISIIINKLNEDIQLINNKLKLVKYNDNQNNNLGEINEHTNKLSIYTRRVMDISNINKYFKENSSKGKVGNINLGDTCFINSSIACLSNCTELTYYFLKGDDLKDINKKNNLGSKGELAKEWRKLLNEYWVENTKVCDPSNLKNIVSIKEEQTKGNDQKDSKEFIEVFLDYLNEDLNKTTKKEYFELKEKAENETDKQASKRFWDNNLKRNDSIITDLFYGQFKSSVICTECGWKSITFVPFDILNLSLVTKYENSENVEEFKFFYIPKEVLRNSYCLNIRNINNGETLDNLIDRIKKEKNFLYHDNIDNLLMVDILRKEKYGFAEKNQIVRQFVYDEDYIFSYDYEDKKEEIIFLTYFFKGGDKKEQKSEYPRMIICKKNETLDDLRKKIYFYLRKYILSPFLKENEEKDKISLEIEKYIEDKNNELPYDKIYKMVESEYNSVFSKLSIDIEKLNKNINKFKSDIPFIIFIRKERDDRYYYGKIPFIDSENFYTLSPKLKEFLEIKDFSCPLSDIQIDINDYEIIVQFNPDSKYINKDQFDLDYFEEYSFEYKIIQNKEKEDDNKMALVKCLKNFCKEEELTNEWYCSKCKKKVLANQKKDLFYLPKILIICINRFDKSTSRWEKNEDKVEFPINNLDMKDFVIGPDKDHSKYDLFAVNQHYSSSTGFGHYTAICKNDGKWYSYDDSNCSETSESEIQPSTAYILFYRRQTD